MRAGPRPSQPGTLTVLAASSYDGAMDGVARLLDHVLSQEPMVTAVRRFPARTPQYASFPEGLDGRIIEALRGRGIERLYTHQARAFEMIRRGKSLVIVTPTASGKSLCYHLPVLQSLVEDPAARALYLFPTKALAQDQLAELEALAHTLPELRIHTYDGDTPQDARRAIRARATLVLTNPDMLHSGILPHHTQWLGLFQNLKYIVIDELHAYRGVFGSHLANLLTRLKRLCRFYGSSPQFICASATIANPEELATRLTGGSVEEISENGAPAGEKVFVCVNPPVVNPELGIRKPYLGEAVRFASRALEEKIPTIVFTVSRLAQEVLLSELKARVARKPGEANLVRGYRGGYLPGRRREVEAGLREGEILGVVATNALELGVDIGQLDVAILAGYPGTIASLWQQAGRAGRRHGLSLAILVASSTPLNQFMVEHPDYLFGASPEHALINPENPYILTSHLKCAAFELPFTLGERFGAQDVTPYLKLLEEEGLLRETGGRYHWTSETYPADHVSLRSVTSDNFIVLDVAVRDARERKSRRVIAEVDWGSAFSMIYPKAIYLLEGEQYEVQELRFREDEEKVAYVKRVTVDYFTDAVSAKGVWILETFESAKEPSMVAEQGELLVAEKTVGFKKIKFQTMENVGSGEVELPQQEMQTQGLWLTVDPTFLDRLCPSREDAVDGLRGLTYLLHHLAPLLLLCDVRDLGAWLGDRTPAVDGGVVLTTQGSRARLLRAPHFEPTLYLYDNYPGGMGLTERLFQLRVELLGRARAVLSACLCLRGCPSCVGPANELGRRAKGVAQSILERLTT